jgi:ribosomal protein S12 methylthiotransferase accessory factor
VVTDHVPKAFRRGTHRAVAPSETVARVRPFLAAMGITRVANVTGLDHVGIPVVMVCRPNSRSLAVSQGKGLDLAAAEASGLMESIELHHAERIPLHRKLGSYADLRASHRLLDVDQLPRVATSRFHPTLPLLWVEGYDLLQHEPVWLPYEAVHVDFTLPRAPGSGCFPVSSNGLASGNHRLEAISHATCEVVERDATALWRLRKPAARQAGQLDLATVDDPACRQVLARYEQAGIGVAVWDVTSDVALPAFRCVIWEDQADTLHSQRVHEGYGCHPARQVALLRALTEAAQVRLTMIAGSRDDLSREQYERHTADETWSRFRARSRLDGAPRDFHDVPTFDGDTFEADVAWELQCLRAAGIERVVAVDLTRPEFGLPVVRVVVPGLEGPYHLPGYLYGARAGALALQQSGRFEL